MDQRGRKNGTSDVGGNNTNTHQESRVRLDDHYKNGVKGG